MVVTMASAANDFLLTLRRTADSMPPMALVDDVREYLSLEMVLSGSFGVPPEKVRETALAFTNALSVGNVWENPQTTCELQGPIHEEAEVTVTEPAESCPRPWTGTLTALADVIKRVVYENRCDLTVSREYAARKLLEAGILVESERLRDVLCRQRYGFDKPGGQGTNGYCIQQIPDYLPPAVDSVLNENPGSVMPYQVQEEINRRMLVGDHRVSTDAVRRCLTVNGSRRSPCPSGARTRFSMNIRPVDRRSNGHP